MEISKMGESGQAIRAPVHPLAHTARTGAVHVGTKIKRFYSVMARLASEPNGFWKPLAVGAVSLIITMLGVFLVYQVNKTDGLQEDVADIKTDIALIKQRMGIEDGR